MRTLDDLLHPITPAEFRAGYEGRKPPNIPAKSGAGKRSIARFDFIPETAIRDATSERAGPLARVGPA